MTIGGTPTEALTLRLFGPYEALRGGVPLPRTRSRREQWLLAFLTLRAGQPVDRNWLAGLFWQERPESAALANLRRSLLDLRRVLGPDAARLTAPSARTLCLDLHGASVDVLEFDAAVRKPETEALEQAVAVYRGPLLLGCTEEWAHPEREKREADYMWALEELAARSLAAGRPGAAARHLRQVLARDPLRQSACRGLMEALAAGGESAAALRVYSDLRNALRAELHLPPDPETTALCERIRGSLEVSPAAEEADREPTAQGAGR